MLKPITHHQQVSDGKSLQTAWDFPPSTWCFECTSPVQWRHLAPIFPSQQPLQPLLAVSASGHSHYSRQHEAKSQKKGPSPNNIWLIIPGFASDSRIGVLTLNLHKTITDPPTNLAEGQKFLKWGIFLPRYFINPWKKVKWGYCLVTGWVWVQTP